MNNVRNLRMHVYNVSKIKIVVLIVTYNSRAFIDRLIDSIFSQDYDLSKLLLIVVDNASKDNTYDEILLLLERLSSKRKANFIAVRLSDNLGFAPANNVGLALAKNILGELRNKILLLLNPDTYIIDKNFFSKVEMLAGILPVVGVATISGEKEEVVIDSLGAFIDFLGNPQDILCHVKMTDTIKSLIKRLPLIYTIHYALFAAVAIKGEIIEEFGFLRNDYVIYFEDTEFCLRLWSKGIPVYVFRDFMVWHVRGGTQKQSFRASKQQETTIFMNIPYHFSKNMLLLTYEYLGPFRYLLRLLIYGLIGFVFKRKHLAFSIVDSLWIIIKKRIKRKKLPKGLIPKDSRTWVLLWALKYKINNSDRSLEEAVSYGVIRASFEYLKLRFLFSHKKEFKA